MDESLTLPTDFIILGHLRDGKRYTPKLISMLVDDLSPSYASDRLRSLENREYVFDPSAEYGVPDRSGMYEITELGELVEGHREVYDREYHGTFEDECREILESNKIDLTQSDVYDLHEVSQVGRAIPADLPAKYDELNPIAPPSQRLYSLYYHGLVMRHGSMEIYELTQRGERVIDLDDDGYSPSEIADRV
ncbi:hypothetical protein HTSR_0931 [Halodesulfurarchaeum formicicum]|uniref:Uncharacterized protein n=1 Tax=Halodesulfurarchaeum formicicum TaxID=1873524 RepID=A0A1D8S431_9EURY|nr:hypothetical protein [Halodesulfurarchaeum formicicum]AOW80116.1 hypothetical protein HTSR_0931 [Halodesulfurarchaeum formicicum]